MTSIHAVIPATLQDAVYHAKNRGEEPSSSQDEQISTSAQPGQKARLRAGATHSSTTATEQSTLPSTHTEPQSTNDHNSESETSDFENSSKENDPSLSPTPVRQPPPNPRNSVLGKRPLAVLSMSNPEDPDTDMMLVDSDSEPESPTSRMTPSEQNITANTHLRTSASALPVRKSPKFNPSNGMHAPIRFQDDLQIYEDVPDRTVSDFTRRFSTDGKENRDAVESGLGMKDKDEKTESQSDKTVLSTAGVNAVIMGPPPTPNTATSSSPSLQSSKTSKKSTSGVRKTSKPKAKPRIGIRRL